MRVIPDLIGDPDYNSLDSRVRGNDTLNIWPNRSLPNHIPKSRNRNPSLWGKRRFI